MITDDIKAKLDIVDYIAKSVPLKKAGKHWKACCPFHAEDTASFMVDAARQSWHCYGSCNEGGDIFSFAMKQHGWSFREALLELAKLAGVEIRSSPTRRAQEQHREKLLGLLKAATEGYQKLLKLPVGAEARRYLSAERHLTPETIEAFQIGYAPSEWTRMTAYLRGLGYSDSQLLEAGISARSERGDGLYDFFRDRIIIPIRDTRGRVIALAGRGTEPKYLNGPTTPLFDKSKVLFGYQREACREQVVIVEGYMDAITAQQAGFKNVVAQMGTALTDHHLELLKNSERIILALDGDAAGQAATQRSIATLVRSGRDVRVMMMPDECDPDDVIRETPDRWPQLIEDAEGIAEYIIRTGTTHVKENAPITERYNVAKRLIPLLMACETLPAKWNVQALAAALKLPAEDLMSIAEPVNPEPDIILLEKPSAPLPLLEIEIIAGFMRDQNLYYMAQRTMREWGIPVLSEQDFSDQVRFMFIVFLEALRQYEMDALEYMESTLPPDAWKPLENAVIPPHMELAIQMLRMKRLQREAQELIAAGEQQAAHEILKQRAKLQFG